MFFFFSVTSKPLPSYSSSCLKIHYKVVYEEIVKRKGHNFGRVKGRQLKVESEQG